MKRHEIAFSGSRAFPDMLWAKATLHKLLRHLDPTEVTILVGDARGIDDAVASIARGSGFTVQVFRAPWDTLGKRAGPARNVALIEHADRLVAFWDGESRGTQHAVEAARRRRIPIDLYVRYAPPKATRRFEQELLG